MRSCWDFMMYEPCFSSKDGRILAVFENLSENLRRSETWMKHSLGRLGPRISTIIISRCHDFMICQVYVIHYSEELCDTSLWFQKNVHLFGKMASTHWSWGHAPHEEAKSSNSCEQSLFLCSITLTWQTYVLAYKISWCLPMKFAKVKWKKHLNIYQGADSNSKWPRATES